MQRSPWPLVLAWGASFSRYPNCQLLLAACVACRPKPLPWAAPRPALTTMPCCQVWAVPLPVPLQHSCCLPARLHPPCGFLAQLLPACCRGHDACAALEPGRPAPPAGQPPHQVGLYCAPCLHACGLVLATLLPPSPTAACTPIWSVLCALQPTGQPLHHYGGGHGAAAQPLPHAAPHGAQLHDLRGMKQLPAHARPDSPALPRPAPLGPPRCSSVCWRCANPTLSSA